jgi:hypothetical protein
MDLRFAIRGKRLRHRTVRAVDRRHRLPGLPQRADEPHVELVRAAELAAAQDVEGMNRLGHGISRRLKQPVARPARFPSLPGKWEMPCAAEVECLGFMAVAN